MGAQKTKNEDEDAAPVATHGHQIREAAGDGHDFGQSGSVVTWRLEVRPVVSGRREVCEGCGPREAHRVAARLEELGLVRVARPIDSKARVHVTVAGRAALRTVPPASEGGS